MDSKIFLENSFFSNQFLFTMCIAIPNFSSLFISWEIYVFPWSSSKLCITISLRTTHLWMHLSTLIKIWTHTQIPFVLKLKNLSAFVPTLRDFLKKRHILRLLYGGIRCHFRTSMTCRNVLDYVEYSWTKKVQILIRIIWFSKYFSWL